MSFHFWLLVFPDINKPIGGVKQMHRLCESLIGLGHKATVVQDNCLFHPNWFTSSVPTISKKDWFSSINLSPTHDYIVLAETFVSGIPIIKPGIPKIIFNQNSSYTFGLLEKPSMSVVDIKNLYHHIDVHAVWCISEYDFSYLSSCLQIPSRKLFKLINPLDIEHLLPCTNTSKKRQISYMPRKNKRDSDVVVAICQSKHPQWKFIPIQNCSHPEVVNILLDSICFLSFGHPEGFGLPVAEAIICGCFVIGYSGLGGRELFNYSYTKSTSIEVQFGDLTHFVDAIDQFIESSSHNLGRLMINLSHSSSQIRQSYSLLEFQRTLKSAVDSLISL